MKSLIEAVVHYSAVAEPSLKIEKWRDAQVFNKSQTEINVERRRENLCIITLINNLVAERDLKPWISTR